MSKDKKTKQPKAKKNPKFICIVFENNNAVAKAFHFKEEDASKVFKRWDGVANFSTESQNRWQEAEDQNDFLQILKDEGVKYRVIEKIVNFKVEKTTEEKAEAESKKVKKASSKIVEESEEVEGDEVSSDKIEKEVVEDFVSTIEEKLQTATPKEIQAFLKEFVKNHLK